MSLVTLVGPSSRYYAPAGDGVVGDVASFRFETVFATRGDTIANLQAAFDEWDGVTSEPEDNAGGWVYTQTYANLNVPTPPSGNTRGLVQEFFPVGLFPGGNPGDFQPNPYLAWGEQSDPTGNVPANVYFRWWMYVPSTFSADIGSGSQSFTSTFSTRDKSIYPTREEPPDPPYNATFHDGLSWDFLLGAGGYEGVNAHLGVPSMPSNEAFLCLDTGGGVAGSGAAVNELAPGDSHKLYQNLNNTTKIVTDTWIEVTLHFDTSSASGKWEAWIKHEGQSRVKVAEWIDGTTEDFSWIIPVEQRGGHKIFQLNSVVNGTGAGGVGDHRIIYDTIDIAISLANLPDYDP